MANRPVKLKLLPRSVMKAKGLTRLPTRILGGDGILVERDAGTWTVSVDPDNLPTVVGLVIGVDVQAQDADLQALADNSTNGLLARTGAGTVSSRTITGTAAEITVTFGDGVSGNPTISIPAIVTFTGKTFTDGTFSSPTLVTPILGVATATSINKVAITAPATSATLTIPDGVTLTGPAASGTAMTLGNAESVSGAKTFANNGGIRILGSSTGVTFFNSANAGASNFTLTFPAATDTLAGLGGTNTWTGANTFPNNGGARILGSSTGVTSFASANSGASNFTLTLPAATDTLVGKATTDTLTNKTLTSPTLTTPALGTPASGVLTSCTGLPLSGLTTQAAFTFAGNNTSGSAVPTAVDIAALTTKASPAAGDYVMLSDQAASGAWKKATVSSVASAGSVSSIAGNTGAFTLGHGVTNATNEIQADASFFPNFIGGLTLSNDVGTPNTVLDIAAGAATDATNATIMKIGAFTKSVSGAWAAGSGSNGMGNGLTIANSTWYHVILANNSGTPDIYFDTSVSGANRPAGIADTKVRRIGSFKTDGSAHIVAFVQVGNDFIWAVPVLEQNNATVPTTATLVTFIGVPTGVKVKASFRYALVAGAAASRSILFQSPDETSAVAGATVGNADGFAVNTTVAVNVQASMSVRTNTSAQLRWSTDSGGTASAYVDTFGWTDWRGNT